MIYEKGYAAVTMTDIAEQTGLSVGGLYYHYHSVESVVLDIFAKSTGAVWKLAEAAHTFDDCLSALKAYFMLEKQDLLNFNQSVNNIIYQYFFSFPSVVREAKMNTAYLAVQKKLTSLFSLFMRQEDVNRICNHIYIILHGLTILAMTGSITNEIIDDEFKKLIDEVAGYSKKTNEEY